VVQQLARRRGGAIDVDAHEVERRRDRLKLVVGERRRRPSGRGEILVGVRSLHHHGHEAGVAIPRRRLRRLDVFGRVDDRYGDLRILGEPDLGAGRTLRPDRLHGEAVAEHGVVANVLRIGIRENHPWCGAEMDGLAATHPHVGAW
jgi:hypothetical protein